MRFDTYDLVTLKRAFFSHLRTSASRNKAANGQCKFLGVLKSMPKVRNVFGLAVEGI